MIYIFGYILYKYLKPCTGFPSPESYVVTKRIDQD